MYIKEHYTVNSRLSSKLSLILRNNHLIGNHPHRLKKTVTYFSGKVEQLEIQSWPSLNKPSAHMTHCVSFGPQHPKALSHFEEQTKSSAAKQKYNNTHTHVHSDRFQVGNKEIYMYTYIVHILGIKLQT